MLKQSTSAARRLTGSKLRFATDGQMPVLGQLYADMERPDRSEIYADELDQPKVSGGLLFVLRAGLTGPDPCIADVIAAVAFVLPVLDLDTAGIAAEAGRAGDAAADRPGMGLYVVSPTPRHLEGLDLGLCGATILKNGEPEAFGAGIACMGHPLNALRFAAKERAELGSPLKAGDVVLVGGLTPAIPVQPKDHVVLNISGVGTTEMRFTDRNGKVQK